MQKIKVETIVKGDIGKVWRFWNEPEHITKWAFASDDWGSPHAENDLKEGGRFLTRMSAKDGSAGFDFTGTYTSVIPNEKIAYTMDGEDARTAVISFEQAGDNSVKIIEAFDPENENPMEMQKAGWQAILENSKKYVESSN